MVPSVDFYVCITSANLDKQIFLLMKILEFLVNPVLLFNIIRFNLCDPFLMLIMPAAVFLNKYYYDNLILLFF